MWTILSIIAAIFLIIYWRGPNAVWGGITFGLIGGLIFAIIFWVLGSGFQLLTIGKGIVVGILGGVVAEQLGKLSRKKQNPSE